MGAHRERQHEDRPEQAATTAPAPALPAPPAPGFSPHTLNGAGIIALQRLVGNAAVAEMMQSRKRPEVREAGQARADQADAPAPTGDGEAGEAGGDPLVAMGSGLLAGAGIVGGPPGESAIEAALEIAAGADGSHTGATPSEANGVNPAPTGVTARDPAAAGALAQPGTPTGADAAGAGATARILPEGIPAPAAPAGGAAPAITVARAVAAPPAPAPAGPAAPGAGGDIRNPHDDPGFKAMKGATKGAGVRSKTHQPAAEGAATAQGAAVPPGNDIPSQAAAAQVNEMGKQQPGVFDKKAFVAAVKKAIDAATPKSLEEVEEFKGSGKAGEAKEEVQGLVKGGKKESEKNIKQATDAPPDQSKATPKPVTPMVNDEPGVPPADVGAADAMPKPRPAQQTDLSGGPAEVDAKMAEAEVTDEQLQKSNEPEFTGALEARDAARKDSATAPGEYRAKEQDVLAKDRGEAEGAAGAELQGMHGARAQALAKVVGKKGETKSADEQKRAKVATDIQGIYDRTKADVTKTLDALDGKVDAAFTKGESAARAQFENYVDKRMSDYKDKRYSGLLGKGKWLKDKVVGMPDEVNRFYEEGKRGYLTAMDGVIGEVADIVGTELTGARTRIAEGRAEVQKYVAKLPADLRDVGKEAADKLESQFEQLSSDVDSKQEALVDKLAQKYVESRDALDARIEELQAANKGWVNKALDAVVGVVNTILKLKDMLMSVLARAADAIGDIIKDPIGFLGNLIDGVKGGLNKFVGRIGTHLQEGLMGWLFGALGSAGITMPKSLDFQGILDLVLQVLGLTYQSVRARIAKLVGEPLVAKMEKTVDVIRDFASKGIAGAWEWIKDKIGDLEDMVLGQIKEFVIEKVIKSGIVWIISLLNPAAAFVKACKAIYDIVMFIVERGSQIMEFVNSIIDSISAIAKGSVGVVVDKIEGALAKALPLAISFLASLLGLGGISEKIRSVIDKVRSPINKAIDVVVGGAVKTFKKIAGPAINAFKKGKAWVKGKVDKGKAWVKGKVDAGKAWAKGKVDKGKKWAKDKVGAGKKGSMGRPDRGKDPAPSSSEGHGTGDVRRLVAAELRRRLARPVRSADEVQAALSDVKSKYAAEGLKSLRVQSDPDTPGVFGVMAMASPEAEAAKFQAAIGLDITDLRFITAPRSGPVDPDLKYGTGLTALSASVIQETADGRKVVTVGRFESVPDDLHAEQVMLLTLEQDWWSYASPNARNTVVIDINRSPCEKCANLLSQFQNQRSKARKARTERSPDYDVSLQINAASLYQVGPAPTADPKAEKSKAGLKKMLLNPRIQLNVLDVIEQAEKQGIDVRQAMDDPKQYAKLEVKLEVVRGFLREIGSTSA